MSRKLCLFVVAGLLASPLAAFGLGAEVSAEALSPEQEQFFEQKVRPVLVAKCVECHGPKKQESGLRVDSRQGLIDGGDSGERAVVPGEPDRSLLVKAINHLGDIHMPPDSKLSADQIADLTDWVRQGLPWAKSSEAVAPQLAAADRAELDRANHWAYQLVARRIIPAVRNSTWQRTAVDGWVLARLEATGITPSPEADRRTLVRRLAYDLVGLPPTPEEVAAFADDQSPDAYERLVDRLLASPHYGERWGRHWLDVARYADTKGYAFAQERRFPYAYTYRDYVIRALNRDLPYDQFITEQLAADRLPPAEGDDKHALAALGFLTTGRKFNNNHDDIDDQIDATTRGLLGLTVSCARCHDHKYDAIPTDDYYSLYGVFASCTAPAELPLIAPPGETAEYQAFEKELAKRQGEFDKFLADRHAEFLDQTRQQSADYLARVAAGDQTTLLAKLPFLSLDPKDLRPKMIDRWRRHLDQHAKADHAALGPWHDLLKVPADKFGEKAAPVLKRWQTLAEGTQPGQVNPRVKAAFAADVPATRMDVPRIYGKLLSEAYIAWKDTGANDEALAKLPEDQRQLAELLLGKNAPTDVPRDDIKSYLNRADNNKYGELKKAIDSHQALSPNAPPRAMVIVDKPQPHNPQVLIRGNPARPGKPVPRQFLLVLAGSQREPFLDGSGRLELARAITAPDNPLTRRVIANRLWMHHFGEPLVLSPSDFGIRSDRPLHPELVDHLATCLLDSDWSLKALHREMVESATYRQSSTDRPDCRAVDSENRLWWRMHRRRLELEAMRDTLLALGSGLDSRMGGRPVELTTVPFTPRRAVYGYIDRQDLPNLFRVFDIASPDQSSPRRPRTTVPQQALFLMNSPLVVEQAKALAARLPQDETIDDSRRIAALYEFVLQRLPTAPEEVIGRQFIAASQGESGAKLSPWEQYAQLLLLTSEVMYID
ncbi:MAG: PSD1 and planctomycete cytochrome C domain-containing protein [Pirellulaceae bacterium]|nr:PSD1 and planctomycete cytochrome C domain-containing protein [Pirellulaceae bacterium]